MKKSLLLPRSTRPTRRRAMLALLAAAATLPLAPVAQAQDFPSRPIRLVVPFSPGGTTDMVARLLAERMGPLLGKPVVVENRAGGGGTIGADAVAKAAPDGHTLLMATVSTHGASPAVYRKLAYDPVRDFQPITNVMSVPSVLVVHPSLPVRSLREFIAQAKAAPGRFSYGSPGNGSLGHANIENFSQLAGIELLHVPYKGSGQALNDALAGTVHALTDNLPSTLPHIQAGKLRPLAVLAPQRSALLPNVPTYRELGFEDMSEGGWFGLMAPAGTPQPVVRRLMEAAHKAMEEPAYREKAAAVGGIAMANTPEQFAAQVRTALARYQRVARKADIQLD